MLDHAADGVRRLDVRIHHVVDAEERTPPLGERRRVLARHGGRARVVGVVAHAGDLQDLRIDGVDEGARDHVDLVVLRQRHQGVRGGDAGLLQHGEAVAVRLDDRAVQLVAGLADPFRIPVDEHDVAAFRHERPRQLASREARANYKYLH